MRERTYRDEPGARLALHCMECRTLDPEDCILQELGTQPSCNLQRHIHCPTRLSVRCGGVVPHYPMVPGAQASQLNAEALVG